MRKCEVLVRFLVLSPCGERTAAAMVEDQAQGLVDQKGAIDDFRIVEVRQADDGKWREGKP